MRSYFGLLALGALLPGGTACRPIDTCAEPGAACGGDPVGAWVETDACQDPARQDALGAKQTYRNQPLVPSGELPPELTSTDWCSSLEFLGSTGIRLFALPRDTPRIQGAALRYDADTASNHRKGLYSTFVTSSDRTSINYSASCLQRLGYAPESCAAFGQAFAAYGSSLGGVKETSCQDSGAGGCVCSYVIESDAAGANRSGIWKVEGHVLTHFAGNMILPTQVDYCVQSNFMTLWGHDRTNILDFEGLRTLVLRKIVCGDGFTDRGEDCDPLDPLTSTDCSSTCQRTAAP